MIQEIKSTKEITELINLVRLDYLNKEFSQNNLVEIFKSIGCSYARDLPIFLIDRGLIIRSGKTIKRIGKFVDLYKFTSIPIHTSVVEKIIEGIQLTIKNRNNAHKLAKKGLTIKIKHPKKAPKDKCSIKDAFSLFNTATLSPTPIETNKSIPIPESNNILSFEEKLAIIEKLRDSPNLIKKLDFIK